MVAEHPLEEPPSEVSPSVSRVAQHLRLLHVGYFRLVINRYSVGRLYRHKGYWHARVRDFVTGRTFRMSSGEKNERKAGPAITVRLMTATEAEASKKASPSPFPGTSALHDVQHPLALEIPEPGADRL